MMRLIPGMLLMALVVGCTSFQPVGPLAGPPGKPTGKVIDRDGQMKDVDLPPEPITVPAEKPTPPVNLVDPSDVAADPYSAAQKLASELEADQKTIPTPSRTAEISRIPGRTKVE